MLVSQRTLGTRFQGLAAALAGKPIFWLVFIVTMFTWPIWRSIVSERDLPSRHRPLLGLVRDFTLRDPSGGELGAAELRGRLWVASFTAVDCEPECAHAERVMATMAELRHRTRNLGDAIRLVTFSVAPDRDTAEQMGELSASHRASHSWRFASGPPEEVRKVLSNFQVTEGIPPTRVALVDGNMQIRGYYDLDAGAGLDTLLRDLSRLLAPGG